MELELPINSEKAQQMSAYMKNLFPFAGVQMPMRKELAKPLLKISKELTPKELFDLVETYYHKTEREYQYIAIDLATYNVKRMTGEELLTYKKFVTEKAWWDSVDAWRKFFGLWSRQNLTQMPQIFDAFFGDENIWNRRIAINLQLLFRHETNLELLKKSIIYDKNTDEFFIQKAIGWSLREYSKTDAQWVQNFITTTQLSSLAVREGSKYLPK